MSIALRKNELGDSCHSVPGSCQVGQITRYLRTGSSMSRKVIAEKIGSESGGASVKRIIDRDRRA